MKIAIPISQGKFCPHFGGAEAFAFFTVDESSRMIGERHLNTPPEHGRGIYPVWLSQQGATIVLAGGMGPRAISILNQKGIEVVLGVQDQDPETMVHAYLDGTLETTGEICLEHGFHDCGHDHGHAVDGCRR